MAHQSGFYINSRQSREVQGDTYPVDGRLDQVDEKIVGQVDWERIFEKG